MVFSFFSMKNFNNGTERTAIGGNTQGSDDVKNQEQALKQRAGTDRQGEQGVRANDLAMSNCALQHNILVKICQNLT